MAEVAWSIIRSSATALSRSLSTAVDPDVHMFKISLPFSVRRKLEYLLIFRWFYSSYFLKCSLHTLSLSCCLPPFFSH